MLTIARGCRRFAAGFRAPGAPKIRRNHEYLGNWGFVVDAEQRRNVESQPAVSSPGRGRSNDETVVRRSAAGLVAKASELEFKPGLDVF